MRCAGSVDVEVGTRTGLVEFQNRVTAFHVASIEIQCGGQGLAGVPWVGGDVATCCRTHNGEVDCDCRIVSI